MPDMSEIYKAGDFIYVRDHAHRMWVYEVRGSGDLVLISRPMPVEKGGTG